MFLLAAHVPYAALPARRDRGALADVADERVPRILANGAIATLAQHVNPVSAAGQETIYRNAVG